MYFLRRLRQWSFLILLLPLGLAGGCGEGGPDGDDGDGDAPDGDGDNSAFVGTWALRDAAGALKWYILFNADNTWLISDTADGSARRVFGTYVVEGNRASGPMVNPGTGEGEIAATLAGSTLNLDFVEFWHSPPKHIPYTGTKL